MKVKEIMTGGEIAFATPKDTIEHVARLMKTRDVGSIPIVDGRESKKLVGIITDRDIAIGVVAGGQDPKRSIVEQFMSRDLATAKPDDDVERIAKLMQEKQVRRVPVCDEQGKLAGMVAQADLARERVSPRTVKETIAKVSEEKRAA